MSENLNDVIKAIRCCRDDNCKKCPLQLEICDELRVDMESLPVELVDKIEEELEEYRKFLLRRQEAGRHGFTVHGV